MKKLLVTLLLAVGFVTVAAADQLNCNNTSTNQCCTDYTSIQNVMNTAGGITEADGLYWLVTISSNVVSSVNNYCQSNFNFWPSDGGSIINGNFKWTAGDWAKTIVLIR